MGEIARGSEGDSEGDSEVEQYRYLYIEIVHYFFHGRVRGREGDE